MYICLYVYLYVYLCNVCFSLFFQIWSRRAFWLYKRCVLFMLFFIFVLIIILWVCWPVSVKTPLVNGCIILYNILEQNITTKRWWFIIELAYAHCERFDANSTDITSRRLDVGFIYIYENLAKSGQWEP